MSPCRERKLLQSPLQLLHAPHGSKLTVSTYPALSQGPSQLVPFEEHAPVGNSSSALCCAILEENWSVCVLLLQDTAADATASCLWVKAASAQHAATTAMTTSEDTAQPQRGPPWADTW